MCKWQIGALIYAGVSIATFGHSAAGNARWTKAHCSPDILYEQDRYVWELYR